MSYVFGCLLSLIERGCGTFHCAISPKQHADNVRKVKAAAKVSFEQGLQMQRALIFTSVDPTDHKSKYESPIDIHMPVAREELYIFIHLV